VLSLLALFWLAGMAGCERVTDVGGEASGTGFDAGSTDAGAADPFRPDPVYGPSATREQFEKFAREISGRWYGIVTRPVSEEALEIELDFQPDEALTQGAFYVMCMQDQRCEPFGFGSSGEGRYTLRHLTADKKPWALGFLQWRDSQDRIRQTSFTEMLLEDNRGDKILSFLFTPSSGPLEQRKAILVRTKPLPSGDGGTQPSDGGSL
jgi:hypothetical protein